MDQYRWLPLTKVRIPTTQHALQRPILAQKVAAAMTRQRLTLLSAPSGSGKTMLAAMAVHDTPAVRVAWVSLDNDDNDPKTFLLSLVTALQTVAPTVGQWVSQALIPGVTTVNDFTRWMGTLVNELSADETPLVLVLDDFHLLTDATVSAGLTYLLERMPPHLHILATTRYEPALPLARLRGQGHIAEFHLSQLLFSPEETAQLLNDELGLALSAEDMAQVQQRSEGWVAGVRLLALSLGEMSAARRRDFLVQLSAQDHYVFDLLAEEVMAHQSAEVRQFLLETSVLRDLTPELCRAVTQRDDAADLLMQVYRRNLFLMAVEDENATRSYRYHALFHDFLRQRLGRTHPAKVRELHQRAAAQSEPLQAFHHYVEAQAWEEAAITLATIGRIALLQGRYGTLRDWLRAIPEPVRHTYPWLLFLEGFLLYYEGDMPRAYGLLQSALAKFEAVGDREGEWETIGALIGNIMQAFNPNGKEYLLELTQRLLQNPIPAPLRARTLMGHAWWLMFEGDWNGIRKAVEEALAVCRANPNLQTYGAVIPHLNQFFFLIENGRTQIVRFYEEFVERFGDTTPFAPIVHMVFANDALFRGDWERVRREFACLERTTERNIQTFYGDLNRFASHHMFALAAGDTAALAAAEKKLLDLMKVPIAVTVIYSFLAMRGYRAWLYRDTATLREVFAYAERLRSDGITQDLNGQLGDVVVAALEVMADNRPQEAETLLRQLVAQQRHFINSLIMPPDARLLLAHHYLRQRRREEALALIEECFTFYEKLDAPGFLLKYGDAIPPLWELAETVPALRPFTAKLRQLWADLREGRSIALPDSDERLTPREVEVLHLLAAGASNRDIAEQLVVSERTVKSHVTHIFDKLGVSSRGQAAARARELHLL